MKRFFLMISVMFAANAAQAQVITSHGTLLGSDCYRQARFDGDLWRGLEICNLALERDVMGHNDRAATFDNRGVILDRLQRTDEAEADFNKAIALRPDLGDAYVNRGAILIKKKRYDEALEQIEHGIALDPSFPPIAEYNRAVALELLGRTRKAYEGYRKVLLMDGSFAQASERLRNFTVLRRTTTPPAN